MTDERFDNLTKLVSKSTTRRGLLKGAAAVALGGVLARVRGSGQAAARSRIKMACARLGQPCNTIPGTPGDHVCCPHLACDSDLTCCKPENETCLDDGDCCADSICRPNPTGLGNRCLPPGLLGAACLETADCAGALVCDASTGLCLEITGTPCVANSDCVSGVCDNYTGLCAGGCLVDGTPCGEDADCCSGSCDPYTALCASAAPAVCTTGTDPETGSPWTVCRADSVSAWVSATGSGGQYHALQICQLLGYSTLGQTGGNCGNECGYCQGPTSCSAPGAETYDVAATCGTDANGLILCTTVMWECLA